MKKALNNNLVKWNKKIVDRHMEGSTRYGKVYIRFNREKKVDSMYTLFGSTKKYMPDEEWMEDLVGAQLKLENLVYLERSAIELAELLRSKDIIK